MQTIEELRQERLFAKKDDLVYEYLFNSIISNKLKVGDKINESQLAQHLGCSRSPIRTALKRLEEDNFVVIEPNRGARIIDITKYMHRDLYYARLCVEPLASFFCAENMKAGELRELKEILDQGYAHFKEKSYLEAMKDDLSFHEHIINCSHSPYIHKLYSVIADQLYRERCRIQTIEYQDTQIWPDHFLIYNCIRSKNEHMAHQAMYSHLVRIYSAHEANERAFE